MLLPPSATLPRLPTAVWRSLHRTLPRPHTRSAAGASSSPAPIPSTLPHYADYPLDRAAALRSDTDRLQQLLLNPTSRLLLYQSGRPLLQPNTDPTAPDPQGNPAAWQPVAIRPASRALPHVRCERETVFLGTDAEGAVFAAEVPDDADVEVLICAMGLSSGTLVGNLRHVLEDLK